MICTVLEIEVRPADCSWVTRRPWRIHDTEVMDCGLVLQMVEPWSAGSGTWDVKGNTYLCQRIIEEVHRRESNQIFAWTNEMAHLRSIFTGD